MNTDNKITLRTVKPDSPQLPLVVQYSLGHASSANTLKVINSYCKPGHRIIGAFMGNVLVGMLGLVQANGTITLCHISVLPDYRRQGVGRLLLGHINKRYAGSAIIAETDNEAVGFYIKAGFSCHSFKGPYGTLRYRCTFNEP